MSGVIQWVTDATEVLVTFCLSTLPSTCQSPQAGFPSQWQDGGQQPPEQLTFSPVSREQEKLVLGSSIRRVRKPFYLSLSQSPLEYPWPRMSQEPIHQPKTYPVSAALPIT